MKIGTVFLLAASAIFLISGAVYGFRSIQVFGYILGGIAIALGINYLVKRKKYGK